LTDYGQARQLAVRTGKMLLIYFRGSPADTAHLLFEQQTLNDPEIRRLCRTYVLLRLPDTATIKAGGRELTLLHHASFSAMNGRPGLAVVDFKHVDAPFYQRTVSCLPFEAPVYYAPPYHSRQSVRVFLDLPPGTISQRTMVYAVRVHPEAPASTSGTPNPILFDAATEHSRHQAIIRRQGHHNWNRRFQRIFRRVGGEHPTEVCAESWPGNGLVAACIDCVHSWRQSPGHWSALRKRQPAYGFDIRRGGNGIWYATGIFGGRRLGLRRS
jgi:hypothetical protein